MTGWSSLQAVQLARPLQGSEDTARVSLTWSTTLKIKFPQEAPTIWMWTAQVDSCYLVAIGTYRNCWMFSSESTPYVEIQLQYQHHQTPNWVNYDVDPPRFCQLSFDGLRFQNSPKSPIEVFNAPWRVFQLSLFHPMGHRAMNSWFNLPTRCLEISVCGIIGLKLRVITSQTICVLEYLCSWDHPYRQTKCCNHLPAEG